MGLYGLLLVVLAPHECRITGQLVLVLLYLLLRPTLHPLLFLDVRSLHLLDLSLVLRLDSLQFFAEIILHGKFLPFLGQNAYLN